MTTTPDAQPILIDTDPGEDIDDVLALAYALLRPELEVVGITTVFGNTRRRAGLVRQLLKILGREDVPVAAGLPRPLAFASDERLEFDHPRRHNHCPPEDDAAVRGGVPLDALRLWSEQVRGRPGEVIGVSIGPTSNLGAFYLADPEAYRMLSRVHYMAGEVDADRVEHNVKMDPVAARHVLGPEPVHPPRWMGTWEVTRRFELAPADCDRLRTRGTPLCEFLVECIDKWWPYRGEKPGPVMYDTSPLAVIVRPDLFTSEPLAVTVEPDGRTRLADGEPTMQVSRGLDAAGLKAQWFETVWG
jgi:inosine-uridine nucleoside N-ribohydrolase